MSDPEPTPTDWSAAAAALRPDPRPWIDGRRVDVDPGGGFRSENPATGTTVAELPSCGAAEIDTAVRSARTAFEGGAWSQLSPRERGRNVRAFAEQVRVYARELALLDTLEMGMPIANALGDMQEIGGHVEATAEMADKLLDEVIPNDPSAWVLNIREPHGVVGAITPWNFPAYIGISKVMPALAVGNSVVLKPSEIASLSCLRLGELAAAAGIPDGVLNIVPGLGGDAGAALARHMDVDVLTFTGSTATGRRLLEYSGQSNMKRLILECGGKSPQIVFPDVADLDRVAEAIVGGITFNTGQVCVAGSRLLVHRSIADALVSRVVAKARAVEPGDPLQESTAFGPLASRGQFERVRSHVAAATEQGAAMLLDGTPASAGGACFWSPTVFADVTPGMRVAQEEIFGPVLSVMTFDSEDEAVSIANGTIYGLTATVWTADLGRALRLARRISAGAVTIGADPARGRVDATTGAFEPHRQSGLGVEGGLGGLRSFTRLKSVTFKS
ncbi:MAG: aldehyde dehydrogenase family protein [Actinomycetes bacterium]